jgi:hypothetical protein
VHGGQVFAGKNEFIDVVESPKGQIMLVRDYFRQTYLSISKNHKEQDVACTIPIATIRDVVARQIVTEKAPPTPPDYQMDSVGYRQPLQSQVTRMMCRRFEVEFTANCHFSIHAEIHRQEFQHGAVFRVKLPHAHINKFLKIIGGLSKKNTTK